MRAQAVRTDCLLLCTTDELGGTERVVCGLTRQFLNDGLRVRTVFPRTERSSVLLAQCATEGIPAEDNPAVLRVVDVHTASDIYRLRQLVRAVQPKAINLHYGSNFISLKDLLAVRLASRSRCVVTVHHAVPWSVTGERKRRITGLAARLTDGVIVSTALMRSVLLSAGIPGSKVHVVPFGVHAPASPMPRSEARAKLGLPEDRVVVASLARLVPHKGIQDLIAAVSDLSGSERDLLLVIAGDGPERPRLQAAAAELGDAVRFLGRIPDPSVLFSAADLFVLPSYEEGFGLVYLEAAFQGVPSIGTRVGGVPDTIHDGVTGLLVSPGDIGALAKAIRCLRDEPELRLKLGEAARTRAHREFTEQRMAARYARLLGIRGGAVTTAG